MTLPPWLLSATFPAWISAPPVKFNVPVSSKIFAGRSQSSGLAWDAELKIPVPIPAMLVSPPTCTVTFPACADTPGVVVLSTLLMTAPSVSERPPAWMSIAPLVPPAPSPNDASDAMVVRRHPSLATARRPKCFLRFQRCSLR